MVTEKITDWNEANQRYLMASLKMVQQELEGSLRDGDIRKTPGAATVSAAQELQMARECLPAPATLDVLADTLNLSSFEKKIILTCAGVELDGTFGKLVNRLQGSASTMLPSFGMALSVFPDAHWSALAPNSPLRYWRIIELIDYNNGQMLTNNHLKLDENILFYLTGVLQLDERLRRIVEPLTDKTELVPSHLILAGNIVEACSNRAEFSRLPVMQLGGDNSTDKAAIATHVCGVLGLDLYSLPAHSIPHQSQEIAEWVRLWNRHAALASAALMVDVSGIDAFDKDRATAISWLIENISGMLFVNTSQWSPKLMRPVMVSDVNKPTPAEQLMLWKFNLGKPVEQPDLQLEKLTSQFDLSTKTINLAGSEAKLFAADNGSDDFTGKLWKTCCKHTRPQVDELAQRIESSAGWDDIVLPADQKDILREVAAQVSNRNKVYDEWGFATKGPRGLGISVLFTGESGTGKTLASEVLANALNLDLFRIDLSQVVNKYIGETEKNLKKIFDAAEAGGAVLLFDEADALFGKRSEVKDSHDRYGNIEVSYLLQRMEAYRGLAILTTNMRSSMDKAFLRRIRFVVQFPFPDATQRAEIWKRVFPAGTPTRDLDINRLSRLNIPGGNIRNIAMNAAFIAAHEGRSVQMSHISRAAHSEYTKLEKPLNNNEIGAIR